MIIIKRPTITVFNRTVYRIQKPGQKQEQSNIGIFHCYALHFEKNEPMPIALELDAKIYLNLQYQTLLDLG